MGGKFAKNMAGKAIKFAKNGAHKLVSKAGGSLAKMAENNKFLKKFGLNKAAAGLVRKGTDKVHKLVNKGAERASKGADQLVEKGQKWASEKGEKMIDKMGNKADNWQRNKINSLRNNLKKKYNGAIDNLKDKGLKKLEAFNQQSQEDRSDLDQKGLEGRLGPGGMSPQQEQNVENRMLRQNLEQDIAQPIQGEYQGQDQEPQELEGIEDEQSQQQYAQYQ